MSRKQAQQQTGLSTATARAYRAALARLLRGEGTHPQHIGRLVRVTPAAIAREARKSRNPLYTTHRDVLDEIMSATEPAPAAQSLASRIGELEQANCDLRADVKRMHREQQQLATENIGLLHRVQVAEARLTVRVARG